jgi:carnosine N-methyltransferase
MFLYPAASSPDFPLDGGDELEWKASFYFVYPASDSVAHQDHTLELDQPSFNELQTALRRYREMADGIIIQLSMAHEVASRTEQLLFPHHHRKCIETSPSFLSSKLEQTIAKAARFLDHNYLVLEGLLKPFPIIVLPPLHEVMGSHPSSIPNSMSFSLSNSHFTFPPSFDDSDQGKSIQRPMQSLARYIPPYNPSQDNADKYGEAPYDTAAHIITHMVRDWTDGGKSIRQDTHDWIVDQLRKLYNNHVAGRSNVELNSVSHSPPSPVLVPGAGLARLAFDIAFTKTEKDSCGRDIESYPFVVEAVDNSIVMAAATNHILHRAASRRSETDFPKVYPFVSDPFTNEFDTRRRWEPAELLDDDISNMFTHLDRQHSNHRPRLSYVVGDFVSIYASPSKSGMYGSIATCFFIDTATNIYEYILTIRNLLRIGGVWINLGPVQWHQNAQLQPSTEELKGIIVLAGFKIIHWEVNNNLLAYRHPDDILTGTRAEAYRPLKFVVMLGPDEHVEDEAETGDLVSSMEVLRRMTGRSSWIPNMIID